MQHPEAVICVRVQFLDNGWEEIVTVKPPEIVYNLKTDTVDFLGDFDQITVPIGRLKFYRIYKRGAIAA